MTDPQLPQYYENDLELIDVNDAAALRSVLEDLRSAVKIGTELVLAHVHKATLSDTQSPTSLYTGDLGIALALLRLERQAEHCFPTGPATDQLLQEVRAGIESIVALTARPTDQDGPERFSPISSTVLGPPFVRLLVGGRDDADVATLQDALDRSLVKGPEVYKDRLFYVHEMFVGRTGMLWTALELKKLHPQNTAFTHLYESVDKLTDVILQDGYKEGKLYLEKGNADVGMPLMWRWFDDYHALGFVHGNTGILSFFLSSPLTKSLQPAYPTMATTITGLSAHVLANAGHLAMSIPPHAATRTPPLLQICHGTPSFTLLLAFVQRNRAFASTVWQPAWTDALRAAAETTWTQGLLGKGISLCHGITGNALPLLMLADGAAYLPGPAALSDAETDTLLARGLSMLLHARACPPFAEAMEADEVTALARGKTYRAPDRPFSLWEGLAGAVAAWAEACLQPYMFLAGR
ncbi:hypothetical protein EJ06DRAFT_524162 [Trichodelitschia bisporula]|uniref:Lanthionine synthetase C family protein n=1 Tax=Trichodelitschia bisporula TaxID=703511 RepID=A0A6G1HM72_9PEZI|nr:hypothetical protein EJ06DRAFT_524162 [Trichodelitschia bisporula]